MANKLNLLKKQGLAVVLAVPIISGVVYAATSGPIVTPSDPEQSTSLPQRITQRKNALKLQLTTAQSQKIVGKCGVAQTGLQDIKTTDQSVAQNRTQVYSDLANQLQTMVTNLQNQSVNTTPLQAAQTKFNSSINHYLTDSVTYKTAMDDVVVMDCTSDPTGFEATLQSARSLRTQLATDAAAIKADLPALTQALDSAKAALIKNNQTSGGGGQ